jgi:hypothetical protein
MEPTLKLRADELDWREVEGEIVALDLRTSEYVAVNKSGAKLWAALAAGATREQLVGMLVQSFEITPDEAAADTDAFLQSLRSQGILVEC